MQFPSFQVVAFHLAPATIHALVEHARSVPERLRLTDITELVLGVSEAFASKYAELCLFVQILNAMMH